jgi:hypothetical protein
MEVAMRRSLMLPLASLLLVPALISCGGNAVPTSAPEAAKEPAAILGHLQYAAVRQDFKALPLVAPITPNVVFPGAMNLHNTAKTLGLTLTAEELKGLGIDEKLAAKLDSLPGSEVEGYGIKDARLAYNAGIYRTLKGVTAKSWGKMEHMGITDEVTLGLAVKQMAIGFGGTKVMTVSCMKMPNGNWGISYLRYDVALKALKQD